MGKKRKTGELGDAALAVRIPSTPVRREIHPFWDRPLTPKQIAKFLQISPSTLTRQLRREGFPKIRVAGQLRFIPREVLDYYRKNTK